MSAASLPSRGAWIEITLSTPIVRFKVSLPSRGAWIEIRAASRRPKAASVAPLAGSVDRNLSGAAKEVVNTLSLPSRGAWIEISMNAGLCRP